MHLQNNNGDFPNNWIRCLLRALTNTSFSEALRRRSPAPHREGFRLTASPGACLITYECLCPDLRTNILPIALLLPSGEPRVAIFHLLLKKPSPMAPPPLITDQDDDLSSSEVDQGHGSLKRITAEEMARFAEAISSSVEDEIRYLEPRCLIGKIWNGSMDFADLEAEIRHQWSFVEGDLKVLECSNDWIQFHFADPVDRDLVWENRPYNISSLLLVLLPWKPGFDPYLEPLLEVDVWIRIMWLPTEYKKLEILSMILSFNKIGETLRHDPISRAMRFARVCVRIKSRPILKGYVKIPETRNPRKVKTYKLWYEGVSEGCSTCLVRNHGYLECPIEMPVREVPLEACLVPDSRKKREYDEEEGDVASAKRSKASTP